MTSHLEQLEVKLDEIAVMVRGQLMEQWNIHWPHEPPANISTKLMRRTIAYQMQAKTLGSLKPAVQKQLRKIARNAGCICPVKSKSKIVIKPGTRFIREWNGKTYVVETIEGGFVWQNQQYNSLSAIARDITGTRWSGPRFFGI